MSWSGALAALQADLVAAGATLSPAITIVRQGEPDSLNADVIAYEYGGDRESGTGGNTLSKTNIEERVTVTVYLRGSVRATTIDGSLEVRLREANRAIKNALWGDWSLGGNSIGISIEPSETAWALIGEQLARTVAFDIYIDLAEVDDIAP